MKERLESFSDFNHDWIALISSPRNIEENKMDDIRDLGDCEDIGAELEDITNELESLIGSAPEDIESQVQDSE